MELFMQYMRVFIFGGLLCAVAQIIIDKTRLTPARILVGYVVAGVALTAFGLYEPFANYAGSGATVPLTGFGYNLAKGVQKAVAENGIMGALSGGFTAAAAALAFVILLGTMCALFFSSKEK